MITTTKKISSVSQVAKICLGIFITAAILVFIIFYSNFSHLKQQKYRSVGEKAAIIENSVNQSLAVYKTMLSTIADKVKNMHLAGNPKQMSLLLKLFYINNNHHDLQANQKINFTDIIWYDTKEKSSSNRYGKTDANLLLPDDLTKNLKSNPGQVLIRSIQNQHSLSKLVQPYLFMGVADNKQEYIGYLAILLDIEGWVHNLGPILEEAGVGIVVVGKDKQALFSSEEYFYNQSFIKSFTIPYSSLSITLGYSKKVFWNDLKNILIPQYLVLLTISSLSIILFFLYRNKIRSEIKSGYSAYIDDLSNAKESYKTQIKTLTTEFAVKEEQYTQELTHSQNLLEAHKMSYSEKDRWLSLFNKKMSSALLDIKGQALELLQSRKERFNDNLRVEEEIEIITNIENKASALTDLYIEDIREEVDIEKIVGSIANIYAKDIAKKRLSFQVNIKSNVKTISFNKILLQQILASLIYIPIESARPKGVVNFKASRKKNKTEDILVISVWDNGFYLSENEQIFSKNIVNKICPLRLDFQTIKQILEKHNCMINSVYTQEGKLVELRLPYKINALKLDNKMDNVVLFKRS